MQWIQQRAMHLLGYAGRAGDGDLHSHILLFSWCRLTASLRNQLPKLRSQCSAGHCSFPVSWAEQNSRNHYCTPAQQLAWLLNQVVPGSTPRRELAEVSKLWPESIGWRQGQLQNVAGYGYAALKHLHHMQSRADSCNVQTNLIWKGQVA